MLKKATITKVVAFFHKKVAPHIFKKEILPVFLIIIAGFIIYANSFKNEFVWDDELLIINNHHIKSPYFIPHIFTTDLFREGNGIGSFYRPIQSITYMVDYAIWKLNPFGYHLTNLILHILTSLTLYYLISLVCHNRKVAFLTSLFFIVHPIHTSAITYISGRAEPIYLFLLLVSLILYLKSNEIGDSKRNYFFFFSILVYILALISKESVLIFPALIILYEWSFGRGARLSVAMRNRWKIFLFIFITFVYLLVRFFILGFSKVSVGGNLHDLYHRILTFCSIFPEYIGLLIYPVNLHMGRDITLIRSIFEPSAFPGILFILFYCLVIIWVYKRSKQVFFGLSWLLVSLIPVSGIMPLNAVMAEHWLYLPAIGFFIILAVALVRVSEFKRGFFKKVGVPVAVVCIILFYGKATAARNNDWKDPITFYRATLLYSPNSCLFHYNLGNAYLDNGDYTNAIKEYELVVRHCHEVLAWNNLGVSYFNLDQDEKAMECYEKALEIEPNQAKTYSNIGLVYERRDDIEKATAYYKKAIEVESDYLKSYYNLCRIYEKEGDTDEALKMFESASRNVPEIAELHYWSGYYYQKKGLSDQAIEEYKMAIRLSHDILLAYLNLALLYEQKGNYKMAIKENKKALRAEPEHQEARLNLGTLYGKMGYTERAIKEYGKVLKINPDSAKAHFNLGCAYANKGNMDIALNEWKKALELDPGLKAAKENIKKVMQP